MGYTYVQPRRDLPLSREQDTKIMKSFVKHDLEKNQFGEETTKEMMENEEEKGNVLTITFWFVIIVVVDVLIFGSTWRRRWSCLEEETLKSFHWNVKWAPVIEYFYFGWSVSYENSMKNHRDHCWHQKGGPWTIKSIIFHTIHFNENIIIAFQPTFVSGCCFEKKMSI